MKLALASFLAIATGAASADARNFKLRMPVQSDAKLSGGGKVGSKSEKSPDTKKSRKKGGKSGKGGDFSAVYGMSNADENEVLVFSRDVEDGTLTFEAAVATGGSGGAVVPPTPGLTQIDPLVAQDLLAVNGRCLFVVNAGSNSVSSFSIDSASQIHLVGTYDTNGILPVSIATRDDLVYVLNAGGQGTFQGYSLHRENCGLSPIGPTVELEQGQTVVPDDPPFAPAAPSEIGFTPDGDIVVNIKTDGGGENAPAPGQPGGTGPGSLNHYVISPDGTTSADTLTKTVLPPSIPFAFDFDDEGRLVLVEFFCGLIQPDGFPGPIPTSCASFWEEQDDHSYVQDGETINFNQFGACWIKYNFKNECSYATNSLYNDISSSISSVSSQNGVDELHDPIAAATLRPLDVIVSPDGNYLYIYSPGIPFDDPDAVTAVLDPIENGLQPHIVVYSAADDCHLTEVQVINDGYDPLFHLSNGPAGLAIYPAP